MTCDEGNGVLTLCRFPVGTSPGSHGKDLRKVLVSQGTMVILKPSRPFSLTNAYSVRGTTSPENNSGKSPQCRRYSASLQHSSAFLSHLRRKANKHTHTQERRGFKDGIGNSVDRAQVGPTE